MKIEEQRFSVISLVFSIICMLIALKIQHDMYVDYHSFGGKTRAFFGLWHLDRAFYGALGGFGLFLGFIAFLKKENLWMVVLSIVVSIISIQLTFSKLWKYFI